MSEIMSPEEAAYRILRIANEKDGFDDPGGSVGLLVKTIKEKYKADYERCQDICQMIREDEKDLFGKEDAKQLKYFSRTEWPKPDTWVFGLNINFKRGELWPLVIVHFGHHLYFFGLHYAVDKEREAV